MSKDETFDDHAASEVAVVGMAGRFPGAKDLGEFWRNLRAGVESVSFFSEEELRAAGVSEAELSDPSYVPAKALLEGVELFDASYFDYNPREAEMLDPQLRLMLECAVEAFEDAGYDPGRVAGRVGVFAGVSAGSYLTFNLASRPDLVNSVGAYQVETGNRGDFVPTTISFKLNLKGPSINVQTACSTSLVAVHAACQSLLNGESDMALAGGASVTFPRKAGHLFREEGIMSPDGHCRPFDGRARGTVTGEGAGLLLLKRLADALEDGDQIHAVIKGSAVNNDGSLKVGFTAPSIDGQAEVVAEALALAGVEAETIGYVEAHGTGTPLGDPIEIAALTQAYRTGTARRAFCAVGSLKSNVGHLDAAAGIAGLIKTVLALKHREIPPSLHYERPNPKIDFDGSPFFVNARLRPWEAGAAPRRAGVSSFGIGGTNAHVILEEAPPPTESGDERAPQLLVLSAKTAATLDAATKNLSEYLGAQPWVNLADVAYTLQVGRREFAHRRALLVEDAADAGRALGTLDPSRLLTDYREPGHRPNVFMFPGQGAQYAGMSRGLYESEPTFRAQLDELAELLLPRLGLDLRGVLYPSPDDAEAAAQLLKQTYVTQPALFVVEYALARLWMSWGVRPAAMIGHSVGEYVAACLAGVFTLEDALALVVERGRLMQTLPAGLMLSVALPEEAAVAILPRGLSLAAVNTPDDCVVAGAPELVEEFREELRRRGVVSQLLQTSHAFHSEMMEPVLGEFAEAVGCAQPAGPEIPFISNVTGTWITAAEATDPSYWARHLRETVRFSRGIGELLSAPERILIEVGPGHSLTTFAKRHPAKSFDQLILSSMRHPHQSASDVETLLTALGKFWAAGGEVEWHGVNASAPRRRLPLPTYPFERGRYYVEPRPAASRPEAVREEPRLNPVAEWFYVPSWKRMALHGTAGRRREGGPKSRWLVLADECGLGLEVAARLEAANHEVVTARACVSYAKEHERAYTFDPGRPEDYRSLLRDLQVEGLTPDRVVNLLSVEGEKVPPARETDFARAQESGLYSLIFLAQSLAERGAAPRLFVVTDRAQEVSDCDVLRPEKATVLAACRVIPHEHPGITCRAIDVCVPPAGGGPRERLVAQLLDELTAESSDALTAYRGRRRWVQTFEQVAPPAGGTRLRERGAYLLTGGTSEAGLALAGQLARAVRARLVLVGGVEDGAAERLAGRVQELEAAGAEVLVLRADVSDEGQMRAALEEAERGFGPLDGVVHGAAFEGPGADNEIASLAPSDCERHFQVGPRGLLVLEKLLQGRRLDFRIAVSSLSSILGGRGCTARAASDIYLDALVQSLGREGFEDWTSVNRDVQSFDGEAFGHLLSMLPAAQLVISAEDLHGRLGPWAAAAPPELHARPQLPSVYAAPENELERGVAGIWQDLLGIGQVGVHDNFFDLGGHSLLATQVISRLRKSFDVELQVRDIFESPTISSISLVLAQRVGLCQRRSLPGVIRYSRSSAVFPETQGRVASGAESYN